MRKLLLALLLLLVAGAARAQVPTTQCVSSAIAGGTGDALTIPLLPCSATTTLLLLKFTAANTSSTPTLQMVGGNALTIITASGGSLSAGELQAGFWGQLINNGLNWILVGGVGSAGGISQLTQDVLAGPGSGSVAATVVGLQTRAVASTAPTNGQVLSWNGSTWAPTTISSGVSGTLNAVAKFTPDGTHVGNSGITDNGTTITNTEPTVINPAPVYAGSQLLSNPTFTANSTGWTLGDCVVWSSGQFSATFTSGSCTDASISASIATTAGHTYLVTTTFTVTGDQELIYFTNNTARPVPSSGPTNSWSFKADFTGTDTIFFDLNSYNNHASLVTTSPISVREITPSNPLGVTDYNGVAFIQQDRELGSLILAGNCCSTVRTTPVGGFSVNRNSGILQGQSATLGSNGNGADLVVSAGAKDGLGLDGSTSIFGKSVQIEAQAGDVVLDTNSGSPATTSNIYMTAGPPVSNVAGIIRLSTRGSGNTGLPTTALGKIVINDRNVSTTSIGIFEIDQIPVESASWPSNNPCKKLDASTLVAAGTGAGGDLVRLCNGTASDNGGAVIGGPTGAQKGNGTLNVAGSIYDNGTAPTGTSGYVRATSPTLTTPLVTKVTASGTAPGAGLGKLELVAGTAAGSCKLILSAGTSATAVTIIDNVGAGC